ncbi:hypothetical protein Patl1_28155 [Pistacia atlantica]|uniref:Uncharacterized protein n=1 Tax=Pistacia atlantica TaxID=434234 RepID=A0ACC1BG48_9ROSI|nr:hypothetical protein Patl1_28155 [Pistacia atlantica]
MQSDREPSPKYLFICFLLGIFWVNFLYKITVKVLWKARPLQNCGGGGTYSASIIFCRFSLKFT